ncbi:MAG TPA: PDZ domain-containing protein, partial [Chitinophagaceae bacterium]
MANNKKLNVFLPLLFSLALALGMLLGFKLRDEAGYKNTIFLHPFGNGAVQEILNLVDVKYVDSVNTRELRKDAIQGILDHLDPHSVYIPSSQLASVNEDLEGNFPGIGVEFNIFSDTVNVTSVVPSGPSEGAGLQTGDKIIRVNDSLVAGNHITADRIRKLLRGPEGTRVNITVFRNSKLLPFTIKRGIIPLYSIDASYMLTNGIGYIKINRFAASTYDEFMKALLSLQKKGMKKLILD